jgi:hypothetical protein
MGEGGPSVVRRVNKDALDLPRKFLFQDFKSKEVVSKDETVVEDIVVCDSMWNVIRSFRVLKKDARLQPWPIFLSDPRQFQFGLVIQEITSMA